MHFWRKMKAPAGAFMLHKMMMIIIFLVVAIGRLLALLVIPNRINEYAAQFTLCTYMLSTLQRIRLYCCRNSFKPVPDRCCLSGHLVWYICIFAYLLIQSRSCLSRDANVAPTRALQHGKAITADRKAFYLEN